MITTAPAQSTSVADKLSGKDRAEGVRILKSLQTVERMTRLGDPLEKIVDAVFANESTQVKFTWYLHKLAGYEVPTQKALVTNLLSSFYTN
jgi:hypothetical protein